MKNVYVFITMTICSISGGVQYLYNKQRYLKSIGYDVIIISTGAGDILVEELKEYEKYICLPLRYSPSFFTSKKTKKTIDNILRLINYNSENRYFIESNSIYAGLWAEMIASKIQCKHILFNLQESHNYSSSECLFLRNKYEREELCGISKKSVSQMLNDTSITLTDKMYFSAHSTNVVEDIYDPFSKELWLDSDLSIFCIGRLNKEYIDKYVEWVSCYVSSNKDKKYNVVFIGGTDKKKIIKRIKNKLKNIKNLNLVITGYVYPIPRSLIQRGDIFVSAAGSANVSYHEGKPTIKINPITAKPLGIVGVSYINGKSNMFDSDMDHSLDEYINEIMQNNYYFEKMDMDEYYKRIGIEFYRQLCFYTNNTDNSYYDISIVKTSNNKKNTIYRLLGKCFGPKLMPAMIMTIRRIM